MVRFRSLLLGVLPLMLSLPQQANAQDPRNGPKVGITVSSITGGGFLRWTGLPKLGPLVGWSFELPVTYQVSVLLEPMYISKGGISQVPALKTRYSTSLSYVEMPLLVKVSTNPDPQGLFLNVGVLYGHFLEGKQKNYLDGQLVGEYDVRPIYKSDWSAALGIGFEKKNWMWEIRGQNSFRLFGGLVTQSNLVFSAQLTWRIPPRKPKEKEEEEEPTE